jgi:hypothetical protein
VIWTHGISSYPFALSDLLGSLDLDPTDRINGGEKLIGVLGFWLAVGEVAARGGRRRGPGDSWTTAMSRQDAGGRSGLGSVNSALDCFQKKEMRTAGGVRCAGELQPWTGCSIPCDKIKEEGSGRCASAREREGY